MLSTNEVERLWKIILGKDGVNNPWLSQKSVGMVSQVPIVQIRFKKSLIL